jgi:DNA-binding response OmpR family regulator
MRILVIDDEPALNRMLSLHLEAAGYDICSALNGAEGLRLASENQIDLVLLDVMMPGIDGWEVCQRLRAQSDVPIIMLTAKTQQADVISGLQLGADDYIKKPFNLRELDLRIEAVLRRSFATHPEDGMLFDDGILCIDSRAGVATARGEVVHLSPTEFRLLSCLAEHQGRVVPHEVLLNQAWGAEYSGDTAVLTVYVRYLRQKLAQILHSPRYIHTVWGVGYRLAPEWGEGKGEEPAPEA